MGEEQGNALDAIYENVYKKLESKPVRDFVVKCDVLEVSYPSVVKAMSMWVKYTPFEAAHDLNEVETFAIYLWSLASNGLQFSLLGKKGYDSTRFMLSWMNHLVAAYEKLPKKTDGEVYRALSLPKDTVQRMIRDAQDIDEELQEHIVRMLAFSATTDKKEIADKFQNLARGQADLEKVFFTFILSEYLGSVSIDEFSFYGKHWCHTLN